MSDEIQYRGCTLTCVPHYDEDGYVEDETWYIHHPSQAADFGSAMTQKRAEALVDQLITNNTIPNEATA